MSSYGPHAVPFPRFSEAEMTRRRGLLHGLMDAEGLTHLIVYGANRFGSGIQWATGWPVTREAMVLVEPGERDVMLVQFYNHLPNARAIATGVDVRWGGSSTAATMAGLLRERKAERVGVIGPLSMGAWTKLSEAATLVEANSPYTRFRMIKSEEEIAFLEVGAGLSDRAMEALARTATPGVSELELAAAVEASYKAEGATNHVHYFAITNMESPEQCVPAQHQARRTIAAGDAIGAEISANYWDYAGQVLRTFTIGSDPTPLYRDLHTAADAAFDAITSVLKAGTSCAQVVDAATVIEDAGFTTYDDLVHGFGGGYLPPILGSRSRTNEEVPDMRFEAGMTVVVQPNVITTDERAGVQTGELVLVTEDGCRSLHHTPRGLRRIG
jgi:Xaa-Pro aminopeptidase